MLHRVALWKILQILQKNNCDGALCRCRSATSLKKRYLLQVFPCEFLANFYKNRFFKEHLRAIASDSDQDILECVKGLRNA